MTKQTRVKTQQPRQPKPDEETFCQAPQRRHDPQPPTEPRLILVGRSPELNRGTAWPDEPVPWRPEGERSFGSTKDVLRCSLNGSFLSVGQSTSTHQFSSRNELENTILSFTCSNQLIKAPMHALDWMGGITTAVFQPSLNGREHSYPSRFRLLKHVSCRLRACHKPLAMDIERPNRSTGLPV